LSSVALGFDGTIKVLAGGQAFEGPPILEVLADGASVGKAEVTSAVGLLNGKLASDAQALASLRSCTFKVKNLDKFQKLEFRYSNDKANNDVTTGDRNLWIGEIEVNGESFKASGLGVSAKEWEKFGDVVALYTEGSLELFRPEKGWPF
jgi:hypothetical protein